ncbi:hypothetical protein DITRI_Ditri18aG0023200 [Diplodiscus trichospermus]
MSLVSQNLVYRNRVKAKRGDYETLIHEDSKDIENGLESDSEISSKENAQDVAEDGSTLFFLDSSADNVELSEESDYEEKSKEMKVVWVDEEGRTSINIAKHAKLNPGTEWAELYLGSKNNGTYDDESSDEEKGAVVACGYRNVEVDDDILRTNEDLVVKSRVKLLPGLLEYSRLVDANSEEHSNGPLNSV